MKTPILETERIILRPLKVSDAQTIFDNWASDPEVTEFMRYSTHETVNTTIEWLTFEESNCNNDKYFSWGFVLKETGELFGSGGVGYKDENNQDDFEIGYNIMKKYWGKGLVTEAMKEVISFAFNELKLSKLYVCHAKDNIGSQRVVEKLGFTYVGDGDFTCFDGRVFQSRKYILEAPL